MQSESQLPAHRQSPPFPTIVSTQSLCPSISRANEMPNLASQTSLAASVDKCLTTNASSAITSPVVSSAMSTPASWKKENAVIHFKASPERIDISNEPSTSASVSANSAVVSVHSTHPAVGTANKTPDHSPQAVIDSSMHVDSPARSSQSIMPVLPPETSLERSSRRITYEALSGSTSISNRVPSSPETSDCEFPEVDFLNNDMREDRKVWKGCTSENTMIGRLRRAAEIASENIQGQEKLGPPDTSVCIDLENNGDENEISFQTGSASNHLQNSARDTSIADAFLPSSPDGLPSSEQMAFLGDPMRNIQLPFPVITEARGKCKPEHSACFLIRHLFTKDVLVKSNVYGNKQRGFYPLDDNKISALREFLQQNYLSSDLNETGSDWKTCVSAINTRIRTLRYNRKKASTGNQSKV